MGIIDGIVEEPIGGAHRDSQAAFIAAGDMIEKGLAEFDGMEPDAILNARRKKFLAIGRNL